MKGLRNLEGFVILADGVAAMNYAHNGLFEFQLNEFTFGTKSISMGLSIPDHIVAQTHMTPAELLLEFAVFLYERERLTLAQAAHLAGLERTEFQQALAARQIPIHFSMEDLKQELNTIEQVKNAYRQRHLAH